MTTMGYDPAVNQEIMVLERVVMRMRTQHRQLGEPSIAALGEAARRLLKDMEKRAGIFLDGGRHLFGDPGWAILLFVFEMTAVGRQATVTDACYASCAPPTTGLRYVTSLLKVGYILKTPDRRDRRRSFLTLTEAGHQLMKEHLARAL